MERIYLRYKKCVQCARINSEAEKAGNCNNDPCCPEGSIEVKIGPNPEIVKTKLYNRITKSFTDDDSDSFEQVINLLSSELDAHGKEAAFAAMKDAIGDILDNRSEEEAIDKSEDEMFGDDNEPMTLTDSDELPE